MEPGVNECKISNGLKEWVNNKVSPVGKDCPKDDSAKKEEENVETQNEFHHRHFFRCKTGEKIIWSVRPFRNLHRNNLSLGYLFLVRN